MKQPELLAPAGDLEKLKVAVLYGADAVYFGGRHFGLRAGAGNFSEDEIAEGVRFAHAKGVKVYVTVNIFAHNDDLERLPPYLDAIRLAGVDGVIVSDPGVLTLLKEMQSTLPVHLSTQANTTNWAAARFWERQGLARLILARELSLEEIKTIRERVSLELEMFVHGAMCVSYSGRCLLSNYFTGRDANRGDCAQACRWKYALQEESRPGEYLPFEEDERGSYILSAKDLCLLQHIPELIGAGINSFKIEGRMKSIYYVAGVVQAYRRAIDSFFNFAPADWQPDTWLEEIGKVSHREYTSGFLLGKPDASGQHYNNKIYRRRYAFTGLVRGYDQQKGLVLVEQRNRFAVGDEVEILRPREEPLQYKVKAIYDQDGQSLAAAPHPQQLVWLPLEKKLDQYAILRKLLT